MLTRRWLMDEWRDAFLLEARLRNLPGPVIGEALAEIDTHCADSGQSPDEAFGDPVSYAQTLARDLPPAASRDAHRARGRSVLMVFATLGGIICLLEGVDAVHHRIRGVLTVGELVTIAAGVAGVAFIVGVLLRPGRRNTTWQLGAATAVGIALVTYPQVAWKHPALHAPGWALLATGLFLFALAWWPTAANRLFADRVIDPRTGDEPFRKTRLVIAAIRWSLPAMLLVVVALTVLLPDSPHHS